MENEPGQRKRRRRRRNNRRGGKGDGNGSVWSIPRTRGIANAIGSFIVSKGRKETGETVLRGVVFQSRWNEVGGGTFFCESIEIFCEMLKRDVYREKLPNIYSSMLNRMIRSVFTILLGN